MTTYTHIHTHTNNDLWDSWSLLIVMAQSVFFLIPTAVPELWILECSYYSTHEKMTFTSFLYTNLCRFQKKNTRPHLRQMLKEVMMLLLVNPCHVVETRLWQRSLYHSTAASAFLLVVSAIPMATKAALKDRSLFAQNAWAHELEYICEGASSDHIYIVISKLAQYQFQTLFMLVCKT